MVASSHLVGKETIGAHKHLETFIDPRVTSLNYLSYQNSILLRKNVY